MGCLIRWFELPPFLVTLAGMFLARGMGFVVHPQSLGIEHPFFLKHITEDLSIHLTERVSVPFTATCYLVIFVAALFVAHYTRFGRYIYALGGDEQSATLMGLPVGRTKIFTYTVSGFCSALSGVVYTFYTQSGDPASCVGLELDAIAAVVIGGTLLSGGVGFMAGTAMGVLILGLIQTLITFQGNLNTWWTRIVVGMLVLAFILLQNVISSASGRLSEAENANILADCKPISVRLLPVIGPRALSRERVLLKLDGWSHGCEGQSGRSRGSAIFLWFRGRSLFFSLRKILGRSTRAGGHLAGFRSFLCPSAQWQPLRGAFPAEGMCAHRSERGACIGRYGKVVVSDDGEIFWDGKSSLANGQHRADGDGVIAGEQRGRMRLRSQDLLHRAVAAFRGEIPFDEKGFIERKVRRSEGGAISS